MLRSKTFVCVFVFFYLYTRTKHPLVTVFFSFSLIFRVTFYPVNSEMWIITYVFHIYSLTQHNTRICLSKAHIFATTQQFPLVQPWFYSAMRHLSGYQMAQIIFSGKNWRKKTKQNKTGISRFNVHRLFAKATMIAIFQLPDRLKINVYNPVRNDIMYKMLC